MDNDHFTSAESDLDSARECKGELSEGYWLGCAQVGALLAIAHELHDVAAELRIARKQREQLETYRMKVAE